MVLNFSNPTAALTYAIDPVYMIHGEAPAAPSSHHGGISPSAEIAVAIVLPLAGLAALYIGALFLMRKLRRRRQGFKRSSTLPRDPGNAIPLASTRSRIHRPATQTTLDDPPPTYESGQVWDADRAQSTELLNR